MSIKSKLKAIPKYKMHITLFAFTLVLSGCINSWTGENPDDVIVKQGQQIEAKYNLDASSFEYYAMEDYLCWDFSLACLFPANRTFEGSASPSLQYTYTPKREVTHFNKTYTGHIDPAKPIKEEDLIKDNFIDFMYNDLPFNSNYKNDLNSVFSLIDESGVNYVVKDNTEAGSCFEVDSEENEYLRKKTKSIGLRNLTNQDYYQLMLSMNCHMRIEIDIYNPQLSTAQLETLADQLEQQAEDYYDSNILEVYINNLLYDADDGGIQYSVALVDEKGSYDAYNLDDITER